MGDINEIANITKGQSLEFLASMQTDWLVEKTLEWTPRELKIVT